MAEYYAVIRNDKYLKHYGVKGMKWGVRKAIERINGTTVRSAQYNKVRDKLYTLTKNASARRKQDAEIHTVVKRQTSSLANQVHRTLNAAKSGKASSKDLNYLDEKLRDTDSSDSENYRRIRAELEARAIQENDDDDDEEEKKKKKRKKNQQNAKEASQSIQKNMNALLHSDQSYLMHYGIKGMQWGARKAIKRGDKKAFDRQYKKAKRMLNKLEKQAQNGAKYSSRAVRNAVGVISAGGKVLAGVTNPGLVAYRAGIVGYNAYKSANASNGKAADKVKQWRKAMEKEFDISALYANQNKRRRKK